MYKLLYIYPNKTNKKINSQHLLYRIPALKCPNPAFTPL